MTEAAPRTSPESSPELPVINGAPEALQLARLDQVVGYGRTITDEFEQEDQASYESFRAQKIDELLTENGIVDSEDEAAHAEYELVRNIYAQVIDLDEDQWLTREDGASVARRNTVFRKVLAAYPAESTAASSDGASEDETDATASETTRTEAAADSIPSETDADMTDDSAAPEHNIDALHAEALHENARFDLAGARESWSTETAKRQGRAFGKTKKHDVVRDEYHAKVQALGIIELENQILPEDDETTRNAKVIAYLFEEQHRLRELTTQKLNGTKVGRFVTFMNRGNLGMRLAKGLGIGLVVGTGGTLLLGAAGAAAGAAVAVGASRFVKGYASNDRHRGMSTAQESFINDDGVSTISIETPESGTTADRLSSGAKVYNERFENDTKEEQVKRRKALAWGVGSVALGASAGYALVAAADKSGLIINEVTNWWDGNGADGNGGPASGANVDSGPDRDGDGIPNALDGDRDGDGVANRFDDAPNNPNVTDRGHDWSDFSREARFVAPGEGGFQTLKEMGIPEQKWESIWETAGAELNEQGKTYMMEDGRWGWSDDMRLSERDLDVLAKAAERHGVNL